MLMIKYLACVLVLAGATLAYADLQQSGKTIRISAPNSAWEMRVPRGTWLLKEERRRADGLAFYYAFTDPKTKTNASFYIEPAEKCKTSVECRNMFWSNPEPVYRNPQSVEQFEENGFAIVQFIVPTIGGNKVNQLNSSAHIVRDGFWIEVHLSKLQSQTKDAAVFSAFFKGISFQQKPAVVDKITRLDERQYPVADRGSLQMSMPSTWNEIIRQTSEQGSFTIVFRPASGEPFEVLVTPAWNPASGAETPMIEAIRERVGDMVKDLSGLTVEGRLKIIELQGASGRGYYFSATDKVPKPGEPKCLAQGMLSVGELAVIFTVRSNSHKDQVFKDALAMLKGAILVK